MEYNSSIKNIVLLLAAKGIKLKVIMLNLRQKNKFCTFSFLHES